MDIKDKIKEFSSNLREKIESNKPLAAIIAITGVLLVALLINMALDSSCLDDS